MTTKEFIMAAANNQELNRKLAELKTPEAIYACAKEAGLTDSMEEFKAEARKLKREASSVSEDLLDDITGGKMMPEKLGGSLSTNDKVFIATLAGAVGVAVATGWLAFF